MKRAILLVDHGSREPEAAGALVRLAAELHRRRPDSAVYVAHLELVPPTIAEAVAAAVGDGVGDLVVHPLFLVPGRHAARDVPAQLAAASAAHPQLRVRITPPTGAAAGLLDLILATLPSD